MDPNDEKTRSLLIEEHAKVKLDIPTKKVRIGMKLSNGHITSLNAPLHEFKECFTWHPNDMPDITTEINSHELNIDHMIKSVTQK